VGARRAVPRIDPPGCAAARTRPPRDLRRAPVHRPIRRSLAQVPRLPAAVGCRLLAGAALDQGLRPREQGALPAGGLEGLSGPRGTAHRRRHRQPRPPEHARQWAPSRVRRGEAQEGSTVHIAVDTLGQPLAPHVVRCTVSYAPPTRVTGSRPPHTSVRADQHTLAEAIMKAFGGNHPLRIRATQARCSSQALLAYPLRPIPSCCNPRCSTRGR
jgi:hypothetical protein